MITQHHQDRLVAQGRDEMMTAFCKVARPNEAQQREASERFTAFMQELVPQIVGVVAVGDYPAFPVKLENIDGKGKIALKAVDVDEAGPQLITRLGASLTLVLTDAEQFDQHRTDAMIELDQRPLPLDTDPEDGGEDFAGEAAEIADEAPAGESSSEEAGPFFTAVEDDHCRLPDGSTITPWTIVHGSMEVFTPVDAEAFVSAAVDHLNSTAAELERDMTPAEVRNAILGVLHARGDDIGLAFHAPYSEDAPAVQDNAPPAADEAPKGKRGPKSAEKVEAYFAGYDGAASDLFADDCPHDRGSLREQWLAGLMDAKAGNAPRWNRPTPPAANDDGASAVEAA